MVPEMPARARRGSVAVEFVALATALVPLVAIAAELWRLAFFSIVLGAAVDRAAWRSGLEALPATALAERVEGLIGADPAMEGLGLDDFRLEPPAVRATARQRDGGVMALVAVEARLATVFLGLSFLAHRSLALAREGEPP